MKLVLNTNSYDCRYYATTTHHEYENNNKVEAQARTENGELIWKIQVNLESEQHETAEKLYVVVPHGTNPQDPPTYGYGQPIQFENLTIKPWVKAGDIRLSALADAVKTPTTNTKPNTPPTPKKAS